VRGVGGGWVDYAHEWGGGCKVGEEDDTWLVGVGGTGYRGWDEVFLNGEGGVSQR